ncbi:MAG: C40 family peptidase [Lachnospiraceae bacterium]|nr:C40 family peptidase [Lachnospiraceae bacterium]
MKNTKWIKKIILICLLIFCVPVMSGPKAEAATEKNNSGMKYRLYLGQSVQLTDYPEGELRVSDEKIIRISENGLVSAVSAGTADVFVKTEEKEEIFCRVEVKENELFEGLTFSEHAYPPKAVGAGTFQIRETIFDGMKCQWSSGNTEIARVDQYGIVTPVKSGRTYIAVKVTDYYGGTYSFQIPVRIIEPHFIKKETTLAQGCNITLLLQDTSGGAVQYVSSNSNVLSVQSQSASGVTIQANKKGTAVITAYVDGVKTACTITVTNPGLKISYGFYEANKSLTIKVTGTVRSSQKIWGSEDSGIATVKNGKVRTKKKGSTVITCQVDGRVLRYYLAVSTKTAVKAMRYGYSRLGKAHYSQARRMSQKYFDCSSFVYRCYRAAGRYLVRRASWAPVAAEIAHHYVRKGRQVKTSKKYSPKQLRPGDLICYGGKKARRNGRYKRIYHIAMYIGNGKTMESSSTFNNVVIKDMSTWRKSAIPVVVRP